MKISIQKKDNTHFEYIENNSSKQALIYIRRKFHNLGLVEDYDFINCIESNSNEFTWYYLHYTIRYNRTTSYFQIESLKNTYVTNVIGRAISIIESLK